MQTIISKSISLPEGLVSRISDTAKNENCTIEELIREALGRYEEHGQLTNAISSGRDRLDALEDFLMEHVNRVIHECRAEKHVAEEARPVKEIPNHQNRG